MLLWQMKLNNYNAFSMPGLTEDPAIFQEKLLITARHDKVQISERVGYWNDKPGWDGMTPATVKALNPAAKVYRYVGLMHKYEWDGIKQKYLHSPIPAETIAQNDWWLRDGNGERVAYLLPDGSVDYYWVDVGKPGYAELYTQELLRRNDGLGFDGFLLDGWWTGLAYILQGKPRPERYQRDKDWFDGAFYPFVRALTKALRAAGYEVVGNCAGEWNTGNESYEAQRSCLDGVVYEEGFPFSWGGNWLTTERVAAGIAALENDPLDVWIGNWTIRTNKPDFQQKHLAAIATYLLGLPQDATLRQKRSFHVPGNADKGFWSDLWEFDIGEPVGSAVRRTNTSFWSRRFERGIVMLNMDDLERTTTITTRWKMLGGGDVKGRVAVKPRSGMVLIG